MQSDPVTVTEAETIDFDWVQPESQLMQRAKAHFDQLAPSKHGPDHPCILFGDRHRCAVEPAPLPKLVDPLIIGVGLVRSRSHDGAGAMNEQASQVLVPALGDAH